MWMKTWLQYASPFVRFCLIQSVIQKWRLYETIKYDWMEPLADAQKTKSVSAL